MSEELLRFDVTWEPADVRRYLLRRLYSPKVLLVPIGCAILGLLWLAFGVGGSRIPWSAALMGGTILLLVPLIFLGALPLLIAMHVQRAQGKGELGGETEWRVQRTGVTIRSGENESWLPWTEFAAAREIPTAFVLEGAGGALLVPKRCLGEKEQRFREILMQGMGERAEV